MLTRLRELYAAAPSGFDAPVDDRLAVERAAGEGAQAYGELREAEALRLLRWLRLGPDDALFDLGAGTGKLVLWAAATTPVGLAVGVELSTHHHAVAQGVLGGLLAGLPPGDAAALRSRVRLVRGDLRAVDLTPATVVYACSNCFPRRRPRPPRRARPRRPAPPGAPDHARPALALAGALRGGRPRARAHDLVRERARDRLHQAVARCSGSSMCLTSSA
ncbi:MAG: hypothetical protein KF878_25435 [Planctomycetes bacterium]|nr:hypothetical protein [Planctomycetota bacterium]